MIRYEENVIVEIDNVEYDLSDKDKYKEFVILITNPKEKFNISHFEIDEKVVDPREKSICEHYKNFFIKFIDGLDDIKEKVSKELEELQSDDVY